MYADYAASYAPVVPGCNGGTVISQGWDKHYYRGMRLRWSRGSMLAFGTQVCGFEPGRNRRNFQGEKVLSTPSF
jgi:hypothetical protein